LNKNHRTYGNQAKALQLKFVYLAQMRNRVLLQINLADTT